MKKALLKTLEDMLEIPENLDRRGIKIRTIPLQYTIHYWQEVRIPLLRITLLAVYGYRCKEDLDIYSKFFNDFEDKKACIGDEVSVGVIKQVLSEIRTSKSKIYVPWPYFGTEPLREGEIGVDFLFSVHGIKNSFPYYRRFSIGLHDERADKIIAELEESKTERVYLISIHPAKMFSSLFPAEMLDLSYGDKKRMYNVEYKLESVLNAFDLKLNKPYRVTNTATKKEGLWVKVREHPYNFSRSFSDMLKALEIAGPYICERWKPPFVDWEDLEEDELTADCQALCEKVRLRT